MPSLLSQAYLIPLEKALNKLIKMDATATEQIAALDGAVIAIHSTSPQHSFFIMPIEDGVLLSNQCDMAVDVKLTAPAPLLLQLLLAKDKQAMLKDSNLMIVGQASILYQFVNVFDTLDPDWNQELQQWLPANLATLISQFVKLGQDQTKQAFSLIQAQLSRLFNNDIAPHQTTDETLKNQLTDFMTSLQNKFGRF